MGGSTKLLGHRQRQARRGSREAVEKGARSEAKFFTGAGTLTRWLASWGSLAGLLGLLILVSVGSLAIPVAAEPLEVTTLAEIAVYNGRGSAPLVASAPAVGAQPPESTTNDFVQAREQALQAALKAGLERAIEDVWAANALLGKRADYPTVANKRLLASKILEHVRDYIASYKIIGEDKTAVADPTLEEAHRGYRDLKEPSRGQELPTSPQTANEQPLTYIINLEVQIFVKKLQQDLAQLTKAAYLPELTLFIDNDLDVEQFNQAFFSGDAGAQTLGEELPLALEAQGFKVNTHELDKGEITVFGKVYGRLRQESMAKTTRDKDQEAPLWQVKINLRAVVSKTGAALATLQFNQDFTAKELKTPEIYTLALKKLAKDSVLELSSNIVDNWYKQFSKQSTINLTIRNVHTAKDLKDLAQFMRSEVPGIQGVKQIYYKRRLAELSVEFMGTSQELAGYLAKRKFNNSLVTIDSVKAHKVALGLK